jgi:hypothetical protein
MGRVAYEDGWIYAVREDNTPLVKIGYTHWVQNRLYGLRSRLKVPLTLLASVYVARDVPQVEARANLAKVSFTNLGSEADRTRCRAF